MSRESPEGSGRRIKATFEGPGIKPGRIPVPTLLKALGEIQRALIIVGEDIAGRPHKRGRLPRPLQEELTLELIRTSGGSFVAECEVVSPRQLSLDNLGEAAIERLLDGMEKEFRGEKSGLPTQARGAVRDLVTLVDGDITKLSIEGGRRQRPIIFTAQEIWAVSEEVRTRGLEPVRITGRLLEIDFKDGTAEMWNATGKMTKVHFPEELAESMKASARMYVLAEGEGRLDAQGRLRNVLIHELMPTEISDEFWIAKSTDELAAEQRVRPIRSINELSAPSFEDVDVDAALADLKAVIRSQSE